MEPRREGKAFETWIAKMESLENVTRQRYIKLFESFLRTVNMSYDQFYDYFKSARSSSDERDFNIVKSKILSFAVDLKKSGKSAGYAKNHLNSIKSFVSANFNEGALTYTRSEMKVLKGSPVGCRNLRKEEIRTLLNCTTSVRNKAMIMSLKDSGLRESDLVELKVEPFLEAISQRRKFLMVKIRQQKTDAEARACFGPDALGAISTWLKYRTSQGISNDSDSPLFLMTNRAEQVFNKKLYPQNVSSVIKRIKDRAGYRKDNVGAHSFRKYFQTSLESSGLNKNWIYDLQGRDIPDSGEAYSKPFDDDLLEAYEKSYFALEINGNGEALKSKMAKLEEENAQLKAQWVDYKKNFEYAVRDEVMKIIKDPRASGEFLGTLMYALEKNKGKTSGEPKQ